MGSRYKIDSIVVCECLSYIRTEEEARAPWREAPAGYISKEEGQSDRQVQQCTNGNSPSGSDQSKSHMGPS